MIATKFSEANSSDILISFPILAYKRSAERDPGTGPSGTV